MPDGPPQPSFTAVSTGTGDALAAFADEAVHFVDGVATSIDETATERAAGPEVLGDSLPARCDVVVAGGGVIGLSCAWRLAGLGMSVLLADPRPGSGASWAAAGMLAPVSELHHGEEELLHLNLAGSRMWGDFAADLESTSGVSVGYRRSGTLVVALDEGDRTWARDLFQLQQSLGLESQWLTRSQARDREPALAPGIAGGVWVPEDHQVNNRFLIRSLVEACRRLGVQMAQRSVSAVTTAGGVITGVELGPALVARGVKPLGAELSGEAGSGEAGSGEAGSGEAGSGEAGSGEAARSLKARSGNDARSGKAQPSRVNVGCSTVVLAAGCHTNQIDGLDADALPPVRPVKGQILRLDRNGVPGGSAVTSLSSVVRGLVQGSSVYLVPRSSGELVIGATSEEMGFDSSVTAGAVYELLRDARRVVPGVVDLTLNEAAAGLRPSLPDNGPAVGVGQVEGLVIATGHYRNGILLAPITARSVACLVEGKPTIPELAPFAPGRFGGSSV